MRNIKSKSTRAAASAFRVQKDSASLLSEDAITFSFVFTAPSYAALPSAGCSAVNSPERDSASAEPFGRTGDICPSTHNHVSPDMPLRAITGSSSVSKACAALVQVLSMPPEGFDLSVKILPGSWVEADDRFVSPNRDYLKRSAMSTPAPTSAASPAYSDEEESIHDDSVSAVPPKKKQRKNSATPSLLTVSSTANSRRASVDSLGDVAPNCSRHSSPDDSLLEDSSIASAATSTAKQGFKKQNMYAPSAMPSLPSRRAAKTVLHVNTDEESDGYQSGANNTSSETENSNPKHPSHGKLNASRSKTVFVLPAGVSPAKPGVCHFCKSNKTGQWRRGPGGMRTLCNACGINWCRKVRAYARNKNMSVEAAERAVGADEAWFRRTCV